MESGFVGVSGSAAPLNGLIGSRGKLKAIIVRIRIRHSPANMTTESSFRFSTHEVPQNRAVKIQQLRSMKLKCGFVMANKNG
jgi:hypothetical protein